MEDRDAATPALGLNKQQLISFYSPGLEMVPVQNNTGDDLYNQNLATNPWEMDSSDGNRVVYIINEGMCYPLYIPFAIEPGYILLPNQGASNFCVSSAPFLSSSPWATTGQQGQPRCEEICASGASEQQRILKGDTPPTQAHDQANTEIQTHDKAARVAAQYFMDRIETGQGEGKKKKSYAICRMKADRPKICEQCSATDTPEWRRGPNGPRTLCNACGLRYSKRKREVCLVGKTSETIGTNSRTERRNVGVISKSDVGQHGLKVKQTEKCVIWTL